MVRTIAGATNNSTPLMYHHRRRVVQVAAVFVAHDVGAQQFVMLSSSSDHQEPPQKKRRGSILLEPVPATGSGSASSSGTHIAGVQNLHTEFLLSIMTVSARKQARGREHMETKAMKREDDRSRLLVLLSIAKATIVPVAPRPPELFSAGQSVHQWWAHWFKGCIKLPKQYGKLHKRPTWFSGEVSATKKAPAPTKTVEPSSQLICSLGALLASEGRQTSGMDARQVLRWHLRDLLVPCPLMERNP